MGLLPDIARDLDGIDPRRRPARHRLCLGVVIGAPILAVATARQPRKRVLLMMVGVFILGNFLSAIAPNYALLMIARILAAFAHGTLFGVGAVVAAGMVPPNRRASAIGLMFTGLTLANILGVPLGTLVGQNFGWRATFGVDHRARDHRPHTRLRARPRDRRETIARDAPRAFRAAPARRAARDRHDHPLLGGSLHPLHLHRAAAAGRDRIHAVERHADPLHGRASG